MRTTPNIRRIIEYWSENIDELPRCYARAIGWHEPFCFACHKLFLVKGEGHAWVLTKPHFELAHLEDYSLNRNNDVSNIVPLCPDCHRGMPDFDKRDDALAWVNDPARLHRIVSPKRTAVSSQTKRALAKLKADGVRLGRPRSMDAEIVARIVREKEAGSSLSAIASGLNEDGIPTSRGGVQWWPGTIKAVLRSVDLDAKSNRFSGQHFYFQRFSGQRFSGQQIQPDRFFGQERYTMNFKQAFEQALKDARSPERIAAAKQNLTMISGLVEVVRENADNVLNDVQDFLLKVEDNLSNLQSEVTEDTVRKESHNWAKVTDISDLFKDAPVFEDDEPVASEAAAPAAEGDAKPSTNREKLDYLIQNNDTWRMLWKGNEADIDKPVQPHVASVRDALIDSAFSQQWERDNG